MTDNWLMTELCKNCAKTVQGTAAAREAVEALSKQQRARDVTVTAPIIEPLGFFSVGKRPQNYPDFFASPRTIMDPTNSIVSDATVGK
jgi:hypothetical protein